MKRSSSNLNTLLSVVHPLIPPGGRVQVCTNPSNNLPNGIAYRHSDTLLSVDALNSTVTTVHSTNQIPSSTPKKSFCIGIISVVIFVSTKFSIYCVLES